jgi:hypothetical protein
MVKAMVKVLNLIQLLFFLLPKWDCQAPADRISPSNQEPQALPWQKNPQAAQVHDKQ